MGARDCIYGPCCGRCEYQDCINSDGICTMYDPECNYPDEEDYDDDDDDKKEADEDDYE